MALGPVEIPIDRTDEMLRAIGELTRKQVLVGIPASTSGRSGEPITNASLGYIHEFGSPARNIPARPWLWPTINRLRDRAAGMLERAAGFATDGHMDDANNQLNALGLLASTEVKKNIVAGGDPVFAPLAPRTQAARRAAGKDVKPLIDTGQMLAAVTYVIRNR